MNGRMAMAACMMLALGFAGCTNTAEPVQVRFETSLGNFTVETLPEHAPITVENFLRYVDEGFFEGLTFHRIQPGFVAQAGGFEFVDGDYQKVPATYPPIKNEATVEEPNLAWTLSMARTFQPDSATSEFFVNLADNRRSLDPNERSAGYAVFAKVVSGHEVIAAMTQVEQGESFSAGGFFPKEPITMERVYRVNDTVAE